MSVASDFSVALFRPRSELTVLHSRSRINFELSRVNRSSQAGIVSPGVFSIGVSLGVVDVFSGKVTAQSLLRDLELRSSVAMSQESESLPKSLMNL